MRGLRELTIEEELSVVLAFGSPGNRMSPRQMADPLTRSELKAFGMKRFVTVGEEDYDARRLPQLSPGR
jgi:hypothetical protein